MYYCRLDEMSQCLGSVGRDGKGGNIGSRNFTDELEDEIGNRDDDGSQNSRSDCPLGRLCLFGISAGENEFKSADDEHDKKRNHGKRNNASDNAGKYSLQTRKSGSIDIARHIKLVGLWNVECATDNGDAQEVLEKNHDGPGGPNDHQSYDRMSNFIAGCFHAGFVSAAGYPLDAA